MIDSTVKGYFTGIGSRNTPKNYLNLLTLSSRYLIRKYSLKLRSGHAVGADRACEVGAKSFADIYLPWEGYGIEPYKEDLGMKVLGDSFIPFESEFKFPDRVKLAKTMYKLVGKSSFKSLSFGIRALMFRNVFQITGHKKEIELSKLVLCYNPGIGGTSYAIALANYFEIPVINIIGKNLKETVFRIDEILNENSL